MPLSNLALLGLGVATTAVVVVVTKKKPTARKKKAGSRPGGFKPPEQGSDTAVGQHPICRKYPGGFWHPEGGYLKGFPTDGTGWSAADLQMAKDAVAAATTSIPPWTSMGQARQMSFDIVRSIIAAWCPEMQLPSSRVALEAYLKKKISLTWMWMTLDPMVWARVIAAREAGLASG